MGSLLVPHLLQQAHEVSVLDLMIYGEDVLEPHPNLHLIKGDIRDDSLVASALKDKDVIIHLACISNDPSFELNPELGKSINYDAFEPILRSAVDCGIGQFIYASSASVYGIKDVANVTEDMPLEPLTDYSKYKAMCETVLNACKNEGMCRTIIRPATLCGFAPRLRLDLTVNILTNLAINKGEITVFGGEQKRPNLHIKDMVNLYAMLLQLPKEQIHGKTFNAGYENLKVREIARMVKDAIGEEVRIITTPSDDQRSYHISSEYIRKEIDFVPQHDIEAAANDLKAAFKAGKVHDALNSDKYYNVRRMQNIQLN